MPDIPSNLSTYLITAGDASEFIANRSYIVNHLVSRAQDTGLDADFSRVSRNLRLYLDWYEGRVSIRFLVRRTGVKLRCNYKLPPPWPEDKENPSNAT